MKLQSTLLSETILAAIEKRKEPVGIMSLADPSTPLVVEDVLSTGLPNLDRILARSKDGRWGLPVGRIVSIKSKPNVGKSSFLLKVALEAYKRGGAVHIVESEHALDLDYARKICAPVKSFLISQPDTLEDAFRAIEIAVDMCLLARQKTGIAAPYLIIMDSFSGFTTQAESDGDFTTKGKSLGEHARLAALACRKLTGPIAKSKAIFLISHQTKSKLGVFWGNPETNIGGDAFNFHDSICLSLYRTNAIKDSKKRIAGHFGLIKTTKNKLFPPHRSVKFKIINGRGFSRNFAVLDFLLERKYIVRRGGWFKMKADPTLKFQGINEFSQFLKDNKEAKTIILGYLAKPVALEEL